jgi:hypothetical protein
MRTVLERAAAAYPLESQHLSDKHSISGINDLVQYTNSRHPDMATCITPASNGHLLRREMGEYFFSFMGRKQSSVQTAAVATIIDASRARTDLDLIMRQSIMAGADLDKESLKEAAAQASSTGTIISRNSTTESLAQITGDKWVDILRLGMEAACYDANKQLSFEVQLKAWRNIDLRDLTSYPRIMACELFYHDSCSGIYGGPFCTDYERFKNLKAALFKYQDEVATELEEIIIDEIETDTLTMVWEDLKELTRRAFNKSTRRHPPRQPNHPPKLQPEPPQIHHGQQQFTPTACRDINPVEGRSTDIQDYADKEIQCIRNLDDGSTCGKKFSHKAEDQLNYVLMGFPNDPKGCPECRQRMREKEGKGGVGMCHEFGKTGQCSKGDKCKFSHSKPPAPKENREIVPYNPEIKAHFGIAYDSDGSDDVDPDCY